jgi:hypothetical protein
MKKSSLPLAGRGRERVLETAPPFLAAATPETGETADE